MATLNSVLIGALGSAGVAGVGVTPAAYLLAEAIRLLNQLSTVWAAEGIVYPTRETLTLVNGTASYTIGTGGTLNTARPARILESKIFITPTEYPLSPLDHEKYERLSDKTVSGQPRYIHYQPTAPYGTIKLYPVPDSNYSMILTSLKPIGPFTIADLASSADLPDGFDAAIEYNVAILLGARFGRQLSPVVYSMAEKSYQAISNSCAAFRMKSLTGIDPTGQSEPQEDEGWFGS